MYLVRDDQTVKHRITGDVKDVVVAVPCDPSDVGNEQIVLVIEPNLSKTYWTIEQKLSHLSNAQVASINVLLREYRALFGDTPHTCPLLNNDVMLNDLTPIHQAPYCLNTEKREFSRKEVRRLQEQGMIRQSLSPWSSPVVPKGQRDYCLCVDYQKVNNVTLADKCPWRLVPFLCHPL